VGVFEVPSVGLEPVVVEVEQLMPAKRVAKVVGGQIPEGVVALHDVEESGGRPDGRGSG
jgi:hypothetical protein